MNQSWEHFFQHSQGEAAWGYELIIDLKKVACDNRFFNPGN